MGKLVIVFWFTELKKKSIKSWGWAGVASGSEKCDELK